MSTTFGSYIRSLRTQNGMTQAQLADRLCVTDKAVSKWERDLSYPDITLFPRLADLLGVTVDDLLRESKNGGQPSRLLQIFEMSHDIRTPLHIILGCANMASLHHEDTALLLRYLESIRISGEYPLKRRPASQGIPLPDNSVRMDQEELIAPAGKDLPDLRVSLFFDRAHVPGQGVHLLDLHRDRELSFKIHIHNICPLCPELIRKSLTE